MSDPQHFLDLDRLDEATLRGILDHAVERKAGRTGLQRGVADSDRPLEGNILAMIFEKPSTRTRVSFDVAMRQLGGQTIEMSGSEMQLGRGESVADTARALSRYVDAIMIRTDRHDVLLELAEHATVPVINGLTDRTHPCQVMADIMTYEEHRGAIKDRKVAWSGDGNNVSVSWMHAATRFGFDFVVACPEELSPPKEELQWAEREGGRVSVLRDPEQAVDEADCVVTDTWVSMSDEDPESGTRAKRHNLLAAYQVNSALMARAKPDALFMHCLPAHRGEEVTEDVIDGPQSVVWDEAENRLHAQKGILTWCLT